MSDLGGFMYASAAPLPTVYSKSQHHEKERQPATLERSNSILRAHNRSRRPFRHARTSSSGQLSRSSRDREPSSPTATECPASWAEYGTLNQVSVSSLASLADPRPSTSTDTSTRPILKSSASTPSSPIFSPSRRRVEKTFQRGFRQRHAFALSSFDLKHVTMHPELEPPKPISGTTKQVIIPSSSRAESISSASGATSVSTRTMTSMDPASLVDQAAIPKTFVLRNGRTYYNDPTLEYPLPHDLTELHRQCLRTLLMVQAYGAPVTSQHAKETPPKKVLELGCGSGFWSMLCHRWFRDRGHTGIEFTGIDIAPLGPGSPNNPADACKPDKDMNWKFIQHDLRQIPWPIPDNEFDFLIIKDVAIMTPNNMYQDFMDEYLRVLKPGATLEFWENDQTIRMLRPHVPNPIPGTDDAKDHEEASRLGAYIINSQTPLSPPLNTFLVEYNTWMSRALEARSLTAVPCTIMGPFLLQEPDSVIDIKSKRLAIPFSEVRWEREGVGGVVTKDGKSYVEMKAKSAPHQKVEKKSLTPEQSAFRKTALLTAVQLIQALEPMLRETSGKSQDEWDIWLGKMMGDLMSDGGTSWGECLELGVWSARKRPQ